MQMAGDASETFPEIREAVRRLCAQFTGEFALPDGKKSLTFRITLSDPNRTLSEDDILKVRLQIIAGIQGSGYEMRV